MQARSVPAPRRALTHTANVIVVTFTCRVTHVPIDVFADVPELELRHSGRRRKFSRGEVVFHEGDPGDSLHRVTSGRFAARVTTPLGDVATFAVHAPGEVFGLLAVLHPDARRTATVVALQASETFAIPRSAFVRLRATYPGMAIAVEQLLVEMLMGSSNRLVEALYTPVHLRVRARLRDLARIYGGGGSRADHDSSQPGRPRRAWPGRRARPSTACFRTSRSAARSRSRAAASRSRPSSGDVTLRPSGRRYSYGQSDESCRRGALRRGVLAPRCGRSLRTPSRGARPRQRRSGMHDDRVAPVGRHSRGRRVAVVARLRAPRSCSPSIDTSGAASRSTRWRSRASRRPSRSASTRRCPMRSPRSRSSTARRCSWSPGKTSRRPRRRERSASTPSPSACACTAPAGAARAHWIRA